MLHSVGVATSYLPLLTPLATDAVDPLTALINYGLAGIVIILLVTGQLRLKPEVAALQKIADDRLVDLRQKDVVIAQLNAAMSDLVRQITAHTLPQMSQTAKVIEAIPEKANEVEAALLKRLEDLTEKLDAVGAKT